MCTSWETSDDQNALGLLAQKMFSSKNVYWKVLFEVPKTNGKRPMPSGFWISDSGIRPMMPGNMLYIHHRYQRYQVDNLALDDPTGPVVNYHCALPSTMALPTC